MGLDTTVIAATSDGKSFTYQILAIVKQGGKCMVVGPLVALVLDQVSVHTVSKLNTDHSSGQGLYVLWYQGLCLK